jgi:hypothetical protein
MNTETRDERWLHDLISRPPVRHDHGFTEAAWNHIAAARRRRRLILGGCGVMILLMWLIFLPWVSVASLAAVYDRSIALLQTAFLEYGSEQRIDLLRQHWPLIFAPFPVVIVAIRNLLASE